MAYADVDDVEAEFPRPMSPAEKARAASLTVVASRLLDQNTIVDPADSEHLNLAKIVVVSMVSWALLPGEYQAHQSYSWKNGTLAGAGTLVADAGGVRLLDWHLAMFGVSVTAMPKGSFPKPWRWPE